MKAHDVFSPWAGESSSERTLYHVATDHIAVFGGDPARRKDKARKRTPPLGLSYIRASSAHSLRPARRVTRTRSQPPTPEPKTLTPTLTPNPNQVSKLMEPYASLELFGTPKDVGQG